MRLSRRTAIAIAAFVASGIMSAPDHVFAQLAVQAVVPLAPVDTLVLRPESWHPLPPVRPDVAHSFAASCTRPDPELAWASLPRPLREISLEAMIGQLLVVSFSGKAPSDAGVVAARDAIAASRIGGVLYFRYNVGSAASVREVNSGFANANPLLSAMIAIDQEGGAVSRVLPTEGAPATPSARAISLRPSADAELAYGDLARNLAALGFTANFGPVVDLEVNADNPVIAKFGRSYGRDVATVVTYAEAFVRAHRSVGVATALKHFPGHGSSTADSHQGAIDLGPTWRRVELEPFREMIAAKSADMVVVGHLKLAGLTGPDGLPASLSPVAIDTFLRGTLCYDGLVVSDDLAMDAIAANWSTTEAAQLMIEAGGDIALISLPSGTGLELVDAIARHLADEARANPSFADRVRHAYARVAVHKLALAEARARLPRPAARPLAQVRVAGVSAR